MTLNFILNGRPTELEVSPDKRLLDLLREDLGLTGTKEGCGIGECGACTVIMDGKAVTACLVPAPAVDGRNVVTIEGVGCDGKLDPVQEAVLENHALQCGFCTPGMVMAGKALIDRVPDPTEEEIKVALKGNICRCTGYKKIIEEIGRASCRERV